MARPGLHQGLVLPHRRQLCGQKQPQRCRIHPDAVAKGQVRADGGGSGQTSGSGKNPPAVFQKLKLQV